MKLNWSVSNNVFVFCQIQWKKIVCTQNNFCIIDPNDNGLSNGFLVNEEKFFSILIIQGKCGPISWPLSHSSIASFALVKSGNKMKFHTITTEIKGFYGWLTKNVWFFRRGLNLSLPLLWLCLYCDTRRKVWMQTLRSQHLLQVIIPSIKIVFRPQIRVSFIDSVSGNTALWPLPVFPEIQLIFLAQFSTTLSVLPVMQHNFLDQFTITHSVFLVIQLSNLVQFSILSVFQTYSPVFWLSFQQNFQFFK